MLRVIVFSTLILICFNSALAQHVTLSPESIDDMGYEHVKVIGQAENGFYLLQSNISLQIQKDNVGFKNRKYKISFYNFGLAPKWFINLEEVKDEKNIDVVVVFKGNAMVLTSQWQRSENTITYYGNLFGEDGKAIISNKKIGTINIEKGNDVRKARVIISHNEQNALVVVEEDRENDQVLHLMTLDTALNMTLQQKPVINYTTKQFDITDMALADGKQVAVIGQSFEKNQNGQKQKLIRYKLLLLRTDENDFEESIISSGERSITEAALSIDNYNRKAVVAGFYNDNESFAGTGILFASSLLDSIAPLEIKSVIIDESARMKLVGERNSGANTGLYTYPIRKLVLRSDGGAVIIAEAAYYSEYSYYDYFTQSFTRRTEYHYDNVVIMSIHTDGTIDWSGVLRKDQVSMDDGGFLSSFNTVLQSDHIDLLYNSDNGRNNEVSLFTINNKGVTEQKSVTRTSEHITIIPQSGKQVDENTLITTAIQKKRLFLVKFELE